jgi:hypothetical protein
LPKSLLQSNFSIVYFLTNGVTYNAVDLPLLYHLLAPGMSTGYTSILTPACRGTAPGAGPSSIVGQIAELVSSNAYVTNIVSAGPDK